MDSPSYHHFFILPLFLLIFISLSDQTHTAAQNNKHHEKHHHQHNFRPSRLFVFGDSYVDTGNRMKGNSRSWKSPYGTSFPGKPTGRFSDGRVLTDYFARYMGLKSPVAYEMRKMVKSEKVKKGMNFAFGGAGVFDTYNGIPNVSTQIDYLEDLIKHKVYTSADLTNDSVALVSVAGYDYSHYMATNGSFQGLPSFVASVVNETSLNVMRIHALGVNRIVVTGLEPLGCLPASTDLFAFTQCYDAFNNFSTLHNRLLNQHILQLNRITHKHSHPPTFFVLDLYTSFSSVLSHPSTYNIHQLFKPCCLGVNASYSCGNVDENSVKRYNVCDNPKSAFFWDSVHPTDAGWHAVYTKLRTMRSFQRLKTT